VTGDNRIAMSLARLHRPFRKIKPQACFAHFRVGTMTAETSAGKNGLHILIEIQMS
jgi:hypothetical protein